MEKSNVWLLRAIIGTLLTALLVGVATGMENIRYSYILLPLFALTTGLVAHTASSGKLSNRNLRLVNKAILVISVLFCIGVAGVAMYLNLTNWRLTTTLILLLAIAASPLTIFAWLRQKPRLLYSGLAVAVILCAFTFDYVKNAERSDRSGKSAGIVLRRIAGDDARVATGLMLWTHPEIFYYADANVHAYNRYRFADPFDIEEAGWVLFHRREWEKWSQRYPDRFSKITELPTHVRGAVLAWHSPKEELKAAAADSGFGAQGLQ